jgi:hypothetical protein
MAGLADSRKGLSHQALWTIVARMRRLYLYLSIVLAIGALIGGVAPVVAQQPKWQEGVDGMVTYICSDGGEWLTCYSLKPADCERIQRSFVGTCLRDAFGNEAQALSQEEGVLRSKEAITCFNREFMSRYGMGKKNTPECQQGPKHLQ